MEGESSRPWRDWLATGGVCFVIFLILLTFYLSWSKEKGVTGVTGDNEIGKSSDESSGTMRYGGHVKVKFAVHNPDWAGYRPASGGRHKKRGRKSGR